MTVNGPLRHEIEGIHVKHVANSAAVGHQTDYEVGVLS
jgi:hypothetical protein